MGPSERIAEATPLPEHGRPRLVTLLFVLYLAGPLLMLVELLHPVLAGALLLAVALAAGPLSFELPRDPGSAANSVRWRGWLAGGALLALTLAWILASGIGGVTFCRSDYVKHLVMFDALRQGHLPIAVTDPRDQSQQLLHYYFAYYIAPVRLAQVTERLWSALNLDLVIVAYYTLAAWAALKVLARLGGVPPLTLLILLVVTGGFDAVGLWAFGEEAMHDVRLFGLFPAIYNMEWWGFSAAPQAFTSHLFWAPQHFFGAFIGLPLLLAALRSPASPARALLRLAMVLACAVFWSPYVAVGLALIAGAELLLRRRDSPLPGLIAGGWRTIYGADWRPALATLIFGALAALFLQASQSLESPRFVLAEVPLGDWLLTFLLNHAPFIAAAAAAFWCARSRGGSTELWRPAALVLLCGLLLEALLLSLIHGRYNDWGMRATLPVLLWMSLPLCRLLLGNLAVPVKALLFLAVGVSSASSIMEIAQSLAFRSPCPAYDAYGFADLETIADQYLADGKSLFYRWLVPLP